MSEVTSRGYFKDDWHCGAPGLFDCNCWKNIDIEKDKKLLAYIFRGRRDKPAEVSYREYKRNPEEGKCSRDMNIYHVDTKTELLSPNSLFEAMFHGFTLQWIAATGKDRLSLAFEHNGVYVEKE